MFNIVLMRSLLVHDFELREALQILLLNILIHDFKHILLLIQRELQQARLIACQQVH